MGAVDLKSMEGSSRNRPANGRSSSSVHGVGRERESELRERERERVREWARVGEGKVRTFNAAYEDGQGKLDGRHVAMTDDPRSRSK